MRVVPAGDLPMVEEAPSRYVVVGSGKTATDSVVWLLGHGVDPDAITWVRPRDPWMLNRAKIQPDPEIYLGMVADMLGACAEAASLDELFLRLEELGIMMRIDRSVDADDGEGADAGRVGAGAAAHRRARRAPRPRHRRPARPPRARARLGRPAPRRGRGPLRGRTASSYPPRLPVWQPDAITLQPIRAGFPCFGAALTGYVEATRADDADKNRLCAPSSYGNTLEDWARMNVLGFRNAAAFNAEPDIRDWAHRVALNPARVPPEHAGSAALDDALGRIGTAVGPALARLERLAG